MILIHVFTDRERPSPTTASNRDEPMYCAATSVQGIERAPLDFCKSYGIDPDSYCMLTAPDIGGTNEEPLVIRGSIDEIAAQVQNALRVRSGLVSELHPAAKAAAQSIDDNPATPITQSLKPIRQPAEIDDSTA